MFVLAVSEGLIIDLGNDKICDTVIVCLIINKIKKISDIDRSEHAT